MLPNQQAAIIDEVRSIYKELEQRPIERKCTLKTECCRFAITGETPHLTRGEALVAIKGLKASGRKTIPEVEDGSCPLLHSKTGKCMIYNFRPFACRTHFCDAAGGKYPRDQIIDLIRQLEVIDHKLGGDGSRKIESALRFYTRGKGILC